MTATVTRIDYTQPGRDGQPVVVARIDWTPGIDAWLLDVLPGSSDTARTSALGSLWMHVPLRTEARSVEEATRAVETIGAMVWAYLDEHDERAKALSDRVTTAASRVGVTQPSLLDGLVQAPPYLADPEPAR